MLDSAGMVGDASPGADVDVDVVVVGAGFAGLYAIHKFRNDLGLRVQAFEAGTGVGGTWFWNRYPGARCDSESHVYCYSFSAELAQEWTWSRRYPEQPEIETYLNTVADKFDLRRDIRFATQVTSAHFDADANRWVVGTDDGGTTRCRYLVTAVGCLSTPLAPDIAGLESFEGEVYYTATWPQEGVDLVGKRVALVGTGSSGIQITPRIAVEADHLTVFQRTPNYSVPAHDRVLAPEEVADVKARYDEIFESSRQTFSGYPYQIMERSIFSVSDEEREEIFEQLWQLGGFHFLWAGFIDMVSDPKANEITCEFIRKKIREAVEDPDVAELLCPKGYPYASRRPPVDVKYYETFNRANVTLVDVSKDRLEAITPTGLRTGETSYEGFDVLVLATGFDAMTGALLRMDIRGTGGVRLGDAWAGGPRSLLGVQVAGFPNMFTLTGPGSPAVLINMPVAIEQHVDWVAACIEHMREQGATRIEPTEEAQAAWGEHVLEVSQFSLFTKGNGWQVGANVAGKPMGLTAYAGGQPMYRAKCDEVVQGGYQGFVLSTPEGSESANA